ARQDAADIGQRLQLSLQGDTYDAEAWNGFYNDYIGSGGDPQNFNAFVTRHLKAANEGMIAEFQRQRILDDRVQRRYRQLQLRQSTDNIITQPYGVPGTSGGLQQDVLAAAEPPAVDLVQ